MEFNAYKTLKKLKKLCRPSRHRDMEDLKDLSGKVMLQSSGLQTILHKDQSMLSAEKRGIV